MTSAAGAGGEAGREAAAQERERIVQAAPAEAALGGAPATGGGPLAMSAAEAALWAAFAVALPAASLMLVAVAPRLAEVRFLTARAFALAHTLTLGVGSLAVMGASYQMSGALLGSRLWGELWIPWQLGGYAAGVAAVVWGFWRSSLPGLVGGGVVVAAAAWTFVAVMFRAAAELRRHGGGRRSRGAVHGLAMGLGTLSFGLVTAWGLVLALGFRYPWWPELFTHHRGLVAHLALGLGGWFGLMVVGVSYRLVPIVHGVRMADERRGLVIVGLVALAVALGVAGAVRGSPAALRLAAVGASAAGPLYVWELLRLLSHRRRRTPDLNVDHWWALCAVTLALSAAGLAWAAGWLRTEPPERLGVASVVLFLLGFVVQAILGQLYKVSPFLMWYYRATVPDVLAIPQLPRLYAPLAGRAGFWLTNAGLGVLTAGILSGLAGVARAGAALYATGALAVAGLLGYGWLPAVLTGRVPFRWRTAARAQG